MEGEIKDDRIELRRTEKEKRPILQRLKRIEGQVRGLQNMIAEDRYCLDEVQQINAMTAALREVALLIISQHVSCGIHIALEVKYFGYPMRNFIRKQSNKPYSQS